MLGLFIRLVGGQKVVWLQAVVKLVDLPAHLRAKATTRGQKSASTSEGKVAEKGLGAGGKPECVEKVLGHRVDRHDGLGRLQGDEGQHDQVLLPQTTQSHGVDHLDAVLVVVGKVIVLVLLLVDLELPEMNDRRVRWPIGGKEGSGNVCT